MGARRACAQQKGTRLISITVSRSVMLEPVAWSGSKAKMSSTH